MICSSIKLFFGWPAFYGDATRLDLLRMAGAAEARVIVVAVKIFYPQEAGQQVLDLPPETDVQPAMVEAEDEGFVVVIVVIVIVISGIWKRHKAAQSGTAAQRPAQRGIHSLPSKTDIPMKFTRLYHCHPLNQRCSITSSPSPSWGTKYYATSRLSSTRPPASTYRYAVVMIVIVGCRRY